MLEEVSFDQSGDVESIVRRLAPRHFDEPDEAIVLATDMVTRFVQSERARQLAEASVIYRELDFMLAWPPGSNEPGGMYLQGTIDCLYRSADGRWHVLDYKTNQVAEGKAGRRSPPATKCKCTFTPWRSSRRWANRSPSWRCISFVRARNI